MSAPGQVFYDGATKRWMKYVPPDSTHWTAGWILYRHADGGWVTLRKASEDDVAAISRAMLKRGAMRGATSMTPQTAKYPLLRRPRAKRVTPDGPRLPVKDHKYCEFHPDRLIPRFKHGARCWLCETKDEKVFDELSFLIKIGLESVPQVRITAAVRQSAMAQRKSEDGVAAPMRATQDVDGG